MSITCKNIRVTPVSSCLYPRYKTYRDEYTGDLRRVSYPCGKCWNCIHNFRESWRIRLFESMMASRVSSVGGFIYDTLTVSNDALPSFSAYDYFTGEAIYPVEALEDDELLRILEHYQNRVPVLEKETVRYWLKKGRENYFRHYHKRCPLKYFGALEYGPLWSRPHVHIAVFGVSRSDWCRFWAKSWRQQMGFTKTKFVDLKSLGKDSQKHCSRISTYISKYLMKGSFDSPLIQWGVVPPAWRVCSHGIGEELLTMDFNHRFKWLAEDLKYHLANRIPVDSNSNSESYQDAREYVSRFESLSPAQVDSLKSYVHDGYKSSLPRYYRDRLCCTHTKGLGGCAIKTALYQDAEQHSFEEVLQFASDCPEYSGLSRERVRFWLEHDLRTFAIYANRYAAKKRMEAIRKAKWHRLSSLNSYKRLRSKNKTGDLGLLL